MNCPACTLVELLESNCKQLSEGPGIYFVKSPEGSEPNFIKPGMGGRFKGQDPNVDIAMLKSRWSRGHQVLYIGKAENLRERVRLLLEFGRGKPVPHWGGRLIWQIEQSWSLLLEWYEHDSPREEERRLLNEFKRKHGQLPFANLQG